MKLTPEDLLVASIMIKQAKDDEGLSLGGTAAELAGIGGGALAGAGTAAAIPEAVYGPKTMRQARQIRRATKQLGVNVPSTLELAGVAKSPGRIGKALLWVARQNPKILAALGGLGAAGGMAAHHLAKD
jgi:hypothetical protein